MRKNYVMIFEEFLRSEKTFPGMIDLNYVYEILKKEHFFNDEKLYFNLKRFYKMPQEDKLHFIDTLLTDPSRRLYPHYLENASAEQIERYYARLVSDPKIKISWFEILFMPKNMQKQYLMDILYGKRIRPNDEIVDDETIPAFAFFHMPIVHECIDVLLTKNAMIPLSLLILGSMDQKSAYINSKPGKFSESEVNDIMENVSIVRFDPKKISWKIY